MQGFSLSKDQASRTEFDDFLLNGSLNQQDFFKSSDRNPPLKSKLNEIPISQFDPIIKIDESNINLIPEGYEVHSEPNDIQPYNAEDYSSAQVSEPLERMPSINLSKISAKPEYSSDRVSKQSKSNSNHSSADSGYQAKPVPDNLNITLSFENGNSATQSQNAGESKIPTKTGTYSGMETIPEQKSCVEELGGSEQEQSELEDEFYFFENNFCKHITQSSTNVQEQPTESHNTGYGSECQAEVIEKEDDDFASKYFGKSKDYLQVPQHGSYLENLLKQNKEGGMPSHQSRGSSAHDNQDFKSANFNSKFTFNSENAHLVQAAIDQQLDMHESDDDQDEHDGLGLKNQVNQNWLDPEELLHVKRSEQPLGFNREDLSSNKLEETPKLSNLTYSQPRTGRDEDFMDEEDNESDRKIVKNIFKDYASRSHADESEQYSYLTTSRVDDEDEGHDDEGDNGNDDEGIARTPVDTAGLYFKGQMSRNDLEKLVQKDSCSEGDSITIEVNNDKEGSNCSQNQYINPVSDRSRSSRYSVETEKSKLRHESTEDFEFVQNHHIFTKKTEAIFEEGKTFSMIESKRSSVMSKPPVSHSRNPSNHQEREIIARRSINQSEYHAIVNTSVNFNDEITNNDSIYSNSMNIGTRVPSQCKSQNMSVQSSVSGNQKISDAKLINYSMQITSDHNSKILINIDKENVPSLGNKQFNEAPAQLVLKNHPEAPFHRNSDKERLYKNLWEENNLLKDMNSKKRQQMEQLKSRIAQISNNIDISDGITKKEGNELIRLKSAIEQAQSFNVTSLLPRML